MSIHFDQLIADVERQAQDEGLQAVGELEQLRQGVRRRRGALEMRARCWD
jgi:hypothetical protein